MASEETSESSFVRRPESQLPFSFAADTGSVSRARLAFRHSPVIPCLINLSGSVGLCVLAVMKDWTWLVIWQSVIIGATIVFLLWVTNDA